MGKYKVVLLTVPEIHHLLYAMRGRGSREEYYGNRPQYERRHERIEKQLLHHVRKPKRGEG